jgi:hypothetical protein
VKHPAAGESRLRLVRQDLDADRAAQPVQAADAADDEAGGLGQRALQR